MKRDLSLHRMNRNESGSSLIEATLILLFLLLLFAGSVDIGTAFSYSSSLQKAANAGALYGTQYPTDTSGMIKAADQDAQDVPGMNVSATYGCECSDGSSQSQNCASTPSCTSGTNEIYYVEVSATSTYKPLVLWPGIPTSYNLGSTVTLPTAP